VTPRPDLQQIIDRSNSLPSKKDIQVLADGGIVILRGKVASDYERRQAELLLRFERGVNAVRNELEIPNSSQ
jgi:osmotically-inducible protein OsmY